MCELRNKKYKIKMKRKFYVKPNTRLFSVELEDTFAGSAEVTNSKENTGRIDRQEINTDWNGSISWGGQWEETQQQN